MKTAWSICVLAALVVPFYAQAGDAPLADKLPGSTLVYVGWAGSENAAFAESMFGQLFQEPATQAMWKAFQQSVGQSSGGMSDVGFTLAEFLATHPVAIAITDFQFDDSDAERVQVKAVLIVDLGKDKKQFAEALGQVLTMVGLAEHSEEVVVGKQKFMTIQPVENVTFTWGYDGNLFIVGFNGAEKDVVGIKASASLASAKPFAAAMKVVAGGPAQVAYYADVKRLAAIAATMEQKMIDRDNAWREQNANPLAAAWVGPARKPQVESTLAALGLDKVTALAGATTIADKGWLSRCKIFSPGPHKGVLAMFSGKPLTPADLATLPGDSDLAFMFRMDPANLLARVREIATAFNPEADEKINDLLKNIRQEIGVDVEKDLFAALGDTWTLTVASSQGGLFSGACATVSVKDAKKLQAAIDKIEAALLAAMSRSMLQREQVKIEQAVYGDMKVRFVSVSNTDIPFAPAWGMYKGRLYVALWPQVVASSARVGGERPGELTNHAGFAAGLSHMSSKPVSVGFINPPQLVKPFYGFAMAGWTKTVNDSPAVAMLRGAGLDVTAASLPTIGQIEKYLWPAVSTVSLDNGGLMFESYTSIPMFGLADAAGTMPVLAAVAVPALTSARVQSRETTSAMNLSNIGKGMAIYAAGNNDQLPPDFEALIEDCTVTEKSLRDPVTGQRYSYVGSLVPDTDGSLILVHEVPDGRPIILVLRRDLSVQRYTAEQFKQAMKKTHEAIEGK